MKGSFPFMERRFYQFLEQLKLTSFHLCSIYIKVKMINYIDNIIQSINVIIQIIIKTPIIYNNIPPYL